MIKINAEQFRELGACKRGLKVFVKAHGENTVTLTRVLESNGLNDTLYLLKEAHDSLTEEQKKGLQTLACDYAEHVLPAFEEHSNDKRPRQAIEVARRFVLGEATEEELIAANKLSRSAGDTAVSVAPTVAAYAAAYAADAADYACYETASCAQTAATYAPAPIIATASATADIIAATAYVHATASATAARYKEIKWQKEKFRCLLTKWENEDEN